MSGRRCLRVSSVSRNGIRMGGFCLALTTLLLATAPAWAVTQHISFKSLSLDDGLSQATVTAIVQDDNGFMWFGTQDGLNRYDGYRFVAHEHDHHNPATLRSDSIFDLYLDRNGDLLIGTEGGGMSRWVASEERIVNYGAEHGAPPEFATQRVRAIVRDDAGMLWVGLQDDGLYRVDETTSTWQRFQTEADNPGSLPDNRIRALYKDRTGRLWIGTLDGLALLDQATGRFRRFQSDPADAASLSDDAVRTILEDGRGRLWVGTLGGGLNLLDRSTGTFTRFEFNPEDPDSLSNNRVRTLLEDSSGQLWVGTDRGINLLGEDGTFKRFVHDDGDPSSLGSDRVMSLFEDRSGMLWAGTQGEGLSRWHPMDWNFGHYKGPAAGLASDVVHAFETDDSGRLYVGTLGGGISVIDRDGGEVQTLRHDASDPASLSDDRVTALLIDSEQTLWVGTMAGGVNRRLRGSGGFEHFRADAARPDSLSNDTIMTVFEDRHGVIWVGTYGGGLNRFDPETGTFTVFLHEAENPASISGNRVSAMVEDPSGALWVGTLGSGLNYFDHEGGRFLHFNKDSANAHNLRSDEILSLYMDSGGVLWIGTQGGGLNRLDRFDGNTEAASFANYSKHDGLPNDIVYGIVPGLPGELWLSTVRGLVRLKTDTMEFEAYGAPDGLQSNEFNLGAYHRGGNGELFFGGVNGFNAFFPDRIQRTGVAPPVVLTSFLKLNEPARTGQPLTDLEALELGWRDYVVSFEFAALDFRAPERNRFAYQLEGLDADWIELGERNDITFTNLEPGQYSLKVRAASSDGVWNEAGINLPIGVAAPPWQQWWAYTLYVLVGLALLVQFLRDRRREKRTQQTLKESAEAAQVANNAKSSFLANMSHEIRTPMNGVLGMTTLLRGSPLNSAQQEKIDIIQKCGTDLLELIDQLLDYSRIESHQETIHKEAFDLRSCVEDVLDVLAPIAEQKGIDLAYEFETNTPEAIKGDRARLRQILTNLVGNGIKFTEKGEVVVSVSTARASGGTHKLRFEVRDSGIGISADKLDALFKPFSQVDDSVSRRFEGTGLGLAISKQLVERMGGRVWVKSVEGEGSVFGFTIIASEAVKPDREHPDRIDVELEGKRLLIVDRSAPLVAILARQASQWGLRVQTSGSAKNCLEKLWTGGGFDALMIDFNGISPGNERWATDLQEICSSKKIPVINLSAQLAEESSLHQSLGAVASLYKPVKPAQMHKVLRSVLVLDSALAPEPESDTGSLAKDAPKVDVPLNILLVDDNSINRRVAMLILQAIGYQPRAAESGEEALELLRTEDYDVVLLDIEMPGMDGFETSRAIWRELPEKRRPQIIAMTAHAVWGYRERCLAAGMDDYVSKPINIRDLQKVLSEVPPLSKRKHKTEVVEPVGA